MRILLFVSIVSIILSACSSNPANGVSGTISGAEGADLYLDHFMYKSPMVTVAKVPIDGSGNFSYSFDEAPEPGIYRLRVGRNQWLTVLDEANSGLQIKGTVDQLSDYTVDVSGNPIAEQANDWMNKVYSGTWKSEDLMSKLKEENHPLVEMLAAVSMGEKNKDEASLNLYTEANNQLRRDLPESDYAKDMALLTTTLKVQIQQAAARAKTSIGSVPPPIVEKDPNGNLRSLDDVKGKVVLVDFWASWCKPCRIANPMVVDLYKKYNKNGFEVFNVSLDKSKEKWVRAIEQDGLIWDHHVSDLRGWSAQPAKDYGVGSIPRTFLIDRDGKIAGVNIRNKQELEEKIKSLL
jgi:thiol-disulfide isomerase/thioredoxin